MRRAALIGVTCAVVALPACSASASPAAKPLSPSPSFSPITENVANPVVPSPHPLSPPPPDLTAICIGFRSTLPHIVYWLAHPDLNRLLHYEHILIKWSRDAWPADNDVTFANYLSEAAVDTGITGAPEGSVYASHAARDLGKVNGYCKYDVGVSMGY